MTSTGVGKGIISLSGLFRLIKKLPSYYITAVVEIYDSIKDWV